MVLTLIHSDPQNTLIFGQKLPIQTAHHTFLESGHPEVTKNLYCVLSTRWSQIPIFLGLKWTKVIKTHYSWIKVMKTLYFLLTL